MKRNDANGSKQIQITTFRQVNEGLLQDRSPQLFLQAKKMKAFFAPDGWWWCGVVWCVVCGVGRKEEGGDVVVVRTRFLMTCVYPDAMVDAPISGVDVTNTPTPKKKSAS